MASLPAAIIRWFGEGDRGDLALSSLYAVVIGAFVITAREASTWPLFVGAGLGASALLIGLWRTTDLTTIQVLAAAVLFRLMAFPLEPSLSDDAFRYVWDGWLQVQGINPYLHAPADAALASFQSAPIYEQLNSVAYHSVYPPLSQLIFAVGGLAYPLGWDASYYVIKAIFVGVELSGVVALSRMVQPQTLVLYAWHPLVVIETAGQAHTEAAMVGLLLVTVWCVRSDRPWWAAAALTGAGWIKLYPLMLFPLLIRRFGWTALWPAGFVTVALSLPYAAPGVIDHVTDSLRLYVQLFEFNAGPYYLAKYAFEWSTGADWSKTLGPAFGVIFGFTLVVLYFMEWNQRWTFAASALAILSMYLACSTTVHPWYLLGPLALCVLVRPPFGPVLWLAALSLGTYLFYIGGPYWTFVMAGWVGAAGLTIAYFWDPILQRIQRRRAKRKVERIRSGLKPSTSGDRSRSILDLGAGEGYVGQEIARSVGAKVMLCDVVDFNRTDLPLVTYDGHRLPFDDNAFEATVLYFVLHHTEAPAQVLREALRVTAGPVIVVESLREGPLQHRVLRVVDQLANRVRSGALMADQEVHLCFRTAAEWRQMIGQMEGTIVQDRRYGSWLHPQQIFVIR